MADRNVPEFKQHWNIVETTEKEENWKEFKIFPLYEGNVYTHIPSLLQTLEIFIIPKNCFDQKFAKEKKKQLTDNHYINKYV